MSLNERKTIIISQIEELRPLVEKLRGVSDFSLKVSHLLEFPPVLAKLRQNWYQEKLQQIQTNPDNQLLLVWLSLIAIKQESQVWSLDYLRPLCKVEAFYQKMGGVVGYHFKVLEMLAFRHDVHNEIESPFCYEKPFVFDLRQKNTWISGIKACREMGEIYLVGGLGDRLKLTDHQGESLPAALLPFLGKSLLEILVRDIAAREYLYYKLFHERFTTPLALMTSLEKENETYIRNHLQQKEWFGRGPQNFILFPQILVPVVDNEGNFVFKPNGEYLLHPGGHGAIWKAAEEEGIYKWFENLSKKAFLIRQINNPVAGIDGGLIAFIGTGAIHQKTLGIASCERVVNAAEGVLVNIKKENGRWSTVNIEYTDFQKHGIEDVTNAQGNSFFSTNTNILYVDLEKITQVVKEHPVPDVLLNMKTKIGDKLAGRLESLMQNITYYLDADKKEHLPTFVTYNSRSKTITTTKKAFENGKSLLETPEGAFFDLLKENIFLAKLCKLQGVGMCSEERYLRNGPSFHFLYHPALGPFYDIITQKIQGGTISDNSELQLEIAELLLENLFLEGSLLIEAENVCGVNPGFCLLKNVRIQNAGIDRRANNCYWKNQIIRKESCQIILGENAEFVAEEVTLQGNLKIRVPSNMRWRAYQIGDQIHFDKIKVDKPLSWDYQLEGNDIKVNMAWVSSLHV